MSDTTDLRDEKLCYPFHPRTCDNPKCDCRRLKQEDQAALAKLRAMEASK